MDWKEETLVITVYDKEDNIIKSIKRIPDDVFHLESKNIDDYKDHDDLKYLYFLTDNLDNYDINEEVPIISKFLIKYNDNLLETNIDIYDYIIKET